MLLKAHYVLPVTAPHIEDGALLVRDGLIADIGKADQLIEAYPEESVRDFGLAAIMPGFVDVHTHLEYSAMRGLVDDLPYAQWKLQLMKKEELLDEADWEDAALLGALECLRSGITTIADITESGASVPAVAAAGLRAVIYREVSAMEKAQAASSMEVAIADIVRWREASNSDLVNIGIGPHSAYSCHPELFRLVAQYAHETGVPVATHLAGSREEYDFVKYGSSVLATDYREDDDGGVPWLPTGVSPVRYVLQWGLLSVPNVLAVHCTQVDDADIDILASNGVSVAFCPRCNAKLGMGVFQLRAMLAKGIKIGIGTDSPASNNTMDMFDEMRIGLLIQRASDPGQRFFDARTFVKLGTSSAAEALGLSTRTGSLEVGKSADVIAVDLSHSHQAPIADPYSTLVHSANQDNVMFTMVAGKTLLDGGQSVSLDVERIIARAEEIRTKLRG